MTPDQRRRAMLDGPITPTILGLAAPNMLYVATRSLVLVAFSTTRGPWRGP